MFGAAQSAEADVEAGCASQGAWSSQGSATPSLAGMRMSLRRDSRREGEMSVRSNVSSIPPSSCSRDSDGSPPSSFDRFVNILDWYVLNRFTRINTRNVSGADVTRFRIPCDLRFAQTEDRLKGICRKNFAERIDLEIKMVTTLPKFFWFCVMFSLFLWIQWLEYNPEQYAQTHRALRSQFKLDSDLYDIDRTHDLVLYLEKFSKSADVLNPLHPYHWCRDNESSILSPFIPNRIVCKTPNRPSFDAHFSGCCAAAASECGASRCSACGATCGSRRLDASVAVHSNGAHMLAGNLKDDRQAGPHIPRTHQVEISFPRRPVAPIQGTSRSASDGHAKSNGVVGVAVNGVLLMAAHYHAGKKQPLAWHFDDCGGHGDTDGWYHYHFPPSCLIASKGGSGPSLPSWWAEDEPELYWPLRGVPSPLLGHALDGHPIYGPYGPEGRLMKAADLDQCHGRFVVGPKGTQEYRYYWLTTPPFLPPCLSGAQAPFHLQTSAGKPCVNSAASSAKHVSTTAQPGGSTWVLKATGCPDHPYFRGSINIEAPSFQVSMVGLARHLDGCAARACSGCNASSCGAFTCGAKGCGTGGCGATNSSASSCSSKPCEAGWSASTCGAKTCGAKTCGAKGCSAGTCGTKTCGAKACGAKGCSAGTCGAKTCGAKTCGAKGCNAGTCGTKTCGAKTCGAKGCNAGTCGAKTCGAKTCGAKGCNAGTCGAKTCGAKTCGAKGCSAGTCGTKTCGAKTCGAKGCSSGTCGAKTCGAKTCGAKGCNAGTCGAKTCGAKTCGAKGCSARTCGAKTCGAKTCGAKGRSAGTCGAKTCGAKTCGAKGCSAGACGAKTSGSCGAGCSVVDIFNPCAAGFGEAKRPPPEFYRQQHPFAVRTASVMPPLLWQTRFEAEDCPSKFAKIFNNQSVNTLYNAPLDAPRADAILRCRGRKITSAPHLGYSASTLGEKNVPKYSTFLSNSIMQGMKDYDWIDDLTDEVALALLIYTPGLDNLSLLRLHFRLEQSGRIQSSFSLSTHSTFRDRPDFLKWFILNIAFLLVAMWRVYACVRDLWRETWMEDSKKLRRFDMALAIFFVLFSVGSLIRRLFVTSLLDELPPLLDSFYAVTNTSDASAILQTQTKYFEILTCVIDRVAVEDGLKITAYFLIIVSILRLIIYMAVHPRIAVLSHTVVLASDNIFHFSLVFSLICGLLAWLACWSFGPDKDVFSTLSYAFFTQWNMIMGEFPFDDPWKEPVLERVYYVCYALLIFFLAVNIFLAIVVEAFVSSKRRVENDVLVERSIVVDLVGLLRYTLIGRSKNWPRHLAVAQHLQITKHFKEPVDSKELKQSRFLNFRSRNEAREYMDFYYGLLGEDILAKQGKDFVRKMQQQRETRRCLVVLFHYPEEEMDRSARLIQEAWQKHKRSSRQDASARHRRRTTMALPTIRSRTVSFRGGENVSSDGSGEYGPTRAGSLPCLLSRTSMQQAVSCESVDCEPDSMEQEV